MRPDIPEEVADSVDQYLESQYGEGMEALPFATKVKLVLRDAQADMNHQTAEGQDGNLGENVVVRSGTGGPR